jgi:predicted lipoprotein with Yx(FWY)xxD motif
MTRTRPITFLASAAVIPLTALAVVGGTHVANARTTHPTLESERPVNAASVTRSSPRPTVQVRRTGLGKILVDSDGRTLYLFKKDTGPKSRCSGSCSVAWPPLLVSGRPTAGTDVNGSKLGTTRRSDGKTQVVYNHHPLYRFVGDKKPGNTNGQGLTAFGARWFTLTPSGNQASAPPSSSGGGGGSDSLGY